MKKKILLGIVIVIVLSIGEYFLYSRPTQALAKCPDAYGTDDVGSAEYLAATNKWTNDFFDSHPDASLKDWGEARHQFWVDNHCTAALQRYEEVKAGNVDPKKMEEIEGILRDAINNPTP